MKKLLFIAMMFSFNAHAIGFGDTDNSIHNSATASATGGAGGVGYGGDAKAFGGSVIGSGNSHNVNINETSNKVFGVNEQGQIQGQSTENANNSSQSVNINHRRIPVSTAYAPSIQGTSPCLGSVNGGVQLFGVGASLGATKEDEECQKLNTSAHFHNLGLHEDALVIACQAKYAKDAPSCKAIQAGEVPVSETKGDYKETNFLNVKF